MYMKIASRVIFYEKKKNVTFFKTRLDVEKQAKFYEILTHASFYALLGIWNSG